LTIYWDRCDLCGLHNPTKTCSLFPELAVDPHCCVACPYWMTTCKNPAWSFKSPLKSPTQRIKFMSLEEREKLMEELTSLLEGKSLHSKTK